MEKNMENVIESGGLLGFKELSLSYYMGETTVFTTHSDNGNLI